MKQIPINDEKIPAYNRKAVRLILILIVCGILLGLVLSYIFIDETNIQIEKKIGHIRFPHFDIRTEPLSFSEILVPSLGVIIVCIATFLLIGLIVVYIKIFLTSNSKYIVGLLFFLIPLLVQTVVSLNVLRQLYISQAFSDKQVKGLLGFGASGLGGIMVIVSIFEIIGLSILLYLSSE